MVDEEMASGGLVCGVAGQPVIALRAGILVDKGNIMHSKPPPQSILLGTPRGINTINISVHSRLFIVVSTIIGSGNIHLRITLVCSAKKAL